MKNFKPNENFLYFLYWMVERQNIFWKKYNGESAPWTEDEILANHKFTNVYRALDRVSQYLINNVIKEGYSKEDMFWRIMVFKHFNLGETWDLIIDKYGDINSNTDIIDLGNFLAKEMDKGATLYSNAYMMTSAFLSGTKGKYCHLKGNGWKKHQYYFYIFNEELKKNRGNLENILNSETFEECFTNLSKITSFADFLSYQIVQDLNYTEHFNFDDNSFCAAGLGTIRGINRVFDITGKADYNDIVKWTHENLPSLFVEYSNKYDIDLSFTPLPNHLPRVPDISNCFCETSKYLKGINPGTKLGEKRIKQIYKNKGFPKIDYVFPKKWGVKL